MWHEWNTSASDVMMMWFAFYANLVTSHLACTTAHGAHALCKSTFSGTKYPKCKLEHANRDSHLHISTRTQWIAMRI